VDDDIDFVLDTGFWCLALKLWPDWI